MTEKTKDETPARPPAEEKNDGRADWSEDQRRRRYYYDDAHGYEIYRPEDEDEEELPDSARQVPDSGAIED